MSREVLREMASAIARLRRVRIEVEEVNRWAERLEDNLAELELLAALALPEAAAPAFRPTLFDAQPAGPGARGAPSVPGPEASEAGPAALPSPVRPRPAQRGGDAPGAAGRRPVSGLVEAARALRLGSLSAEELAQAQLEVIARSEDHRAYTAVFGERARQEARQAAAALRSGTAGLLAGVTVAVKDLMDIAGHAVTGGSRALQRDPSPADAPVVARLRAAGAVVVGAANLHELAYGVTSENPHFGVVRNPRHPGRVAGGSSGGSAAAVAAGLALGAVGTDTGGSIRIPSACCGISGLKPTYDRVSREGVIPLSWSLDHVGPMAASVADVAVLWAAMADEPLPQETALARCLVDPALCPEDQLPPPLAASARLALAGLPPDGAGPAGGQAATEEALRQSLGGLRLGCPGEDWLGALEAGVARAWSRALERLDAVGVSVQRVQPPSMGYVRAAQFVVLQAEATAVHRARLYARPEALGPDVRLRLQLGEFLTAVDYVQGQRLRGQVAAGFARLWEQVDLLLLPCLPVAAPPLGSRILRVGEAPPEPVHRVLTRFTAAFNLSGLPALALPMGVDDEGLPVALQVVGRPWAELDVLRAGMALQALLQGA